jgi:hypothetical protein
MDLYFVTIQVRQFNIGFSDSPFQTERSCVKYIYQIINHRRSLPDKNDFRRKERCCKEPVFIWNW